MVWPILAWQWLANAAVGGLIVLALGGLAVRVCRQPVRRSRLVVLSLLGGLAVPALMAVPVAPRWSTRLLPAMGRDDGASQFDVVQGAAIETEARPIAGMTNPSLTVASRNRGEAERIGGVVEHTTASRPSTTVTVSWPILIPVLYLAAMAGMSAWWLFGQVLLWRVTRAARPAPQAVRDQFLTISGQAGQRVRLLESDRIALPITYTWARPVILLPSSLRGEHDGPALSYCLAHEWSHVERRDARAWAVATLAGTILFYQPLYWWLRRQLRLCQDYLADDRAAAVGSPEDYAAYLVRLARARQFGMPLPALGVGDRRSNLYRRVVMLVQDREPLEHRCRTAWSLAAGVVAVLVIAAVSGMRLDAADPAVSLPQQAVDVKDKETTKDASNATKKAEGARTFMGRVTEKDTGKPIADAAVFVRVYMYDKTRTEKILEETRQKTDAQGRFRVTLTPGQMVEPSLSFYLEVEHPGYVFYYNTQGYGTIVKTEKLGDRPFFETITLRTGKPIEGRLVNPEGTPVAGVRINAFCTNPELKREDPNEWGAFMWTSTNADGRFRLNLFPSGPAVFWVLPERYAQSTHVLKNDKRGDMGTIALDVGNTIRGKALDSQGKPVAGVCVRADRDRTKELEAENELKFAADHICRSVVTGADGGFTIRALPPGDYSVAVVDVGWDLATRRNVEDMSRGPLPGVFTAQRLTVKDGVTPEPLVIRAVPHAVVEAQVYDSKGAKAKGYNAFIIGRIDGDYWSTDVQPNEDGAYTFLAPHGLEETRIDLQTSAHSVLRHRMSKDAPLSNASSLQLGTLDHDIKGIEIIRYVAPIAIVKVVTKDGTRPDEVVVSADYTENQGKPRGGRRILKNHVLSDCGFEEQADGRFRSVGLFPDEAVTVTAHAKGYVSKTSAAITLPEGATREIELVLSQ